MTFRSTSRIRALRNTLFCLTLSSLLFVAGCADGPAATSIVTVTNSTGSTLTKYAPAGANAPLALGVNPQGCMFASTELATGTPVERRMPRPPQALR